jgi:hypothetical protein
LAGSLATIAISTLPSRQACAGASAAHTVVLFSREDARKLRLTEEQWRQIPQTRALSVGPNIVIRSPQVVPGDVPTIETRTPANLVVLFEARNSPVDMSSLEVEAHKGFFSKSLTDLLRPYIHGDAIELSEVEIPAGKFMLVISIADQARDTTVTTYRLEVKGE